MKVYNPIKDSHYIELTTSKKENEKLVIEKYKNNTEKVKKELDLNNSDN